MGSWLNVGRFGRGGWLLGLVVLLIMVACEPLAPQSDPQVIIVTSESDLTLTPSDSLANIPTASPSPIPTRPPSPTPTERIIPTATVPPCDQDTGTLFETSFQSEIQGDEVPYNVYLPPCFFETGRRYPYLILMHGSGYDFTQWETLEIETVLNEGIAGDPQTLPPMMVVMPEGGALQENNFFDAGVSYEDLMLREFIPELESRFCVWQNSAGRGIGGISRGGFWAFSIALRNPEQFVSVGGHSPWFVPDNAPATHNPLALAERATNIEGLRIYLDIAQNDNGAANVNVFSNALNTRGIPHTYTINVLGDHNNTYWASRLPEYLAFYGQSWSLDVADYPSCQE